MDTLNTANDNLPFTGEDRRGGALAPHETILERGGHCRVHASWGTTSSDFKSIMLEDGQAFLENHDVEQ